MDVDDLFVSLPASRAERWPWIAALVAAWFSPLRPEDGIPEEAIRRAEARLGVALPKALREAYLLFGRREEITTDRFRLLPPLELRVREGLLTIAQGSSARWAIRVDDLSLEDPPVVVVDEDGQRHPAFDGDDTTVSRFMVYMAIVESVASSRYGNDAFGEPMDEVLPALEKGFRLLDFGEVAHPEPAKRLYGGRRSIVLVAPSDGDLKVGAPDLESYRAAVASIGDLDWNCEENEAHQGEFHEQKERLATVDGWLQDLRQARLEALRKEVDEAEERRERWEGADPDGELDVDPRLEELCARAIVPYARVLPPVARAYFEKWGAVMLDVHPRLTAWVRAFTGATHRDDVETRPSPRLPDYDDLVRSLPPEQQIAAEVLALDGMPTRMQKGIERLQGVLSRGSNVDAALLSRAEQATLRVLFRWPPRPPADPDERERELYRIVREIMAALFAGICEQQRMFMDAGYAEALEGYAWARLVFEDFHVPPAEGIVLARYFAGSVREKLAAEDVEPLRAALDHLADAVASAPERIDLPEGMTGAWSPSARPWVEAQLARERVRVEERRAARRKK